VIELSGFSKSIVAAVIRLIGIERAVIAIVLVSNLLTYGGVSLFVVVFAVYPFAAEAFRQGNIPKRLIPGTIALGAFSFTMDSLPGTPQIQNIIPTTFFKTDAYAGPWLGLIGSVFIFVSGVAYLTWRMRTAQAAGEGYGTGHTQEPEPPAEGALPNPLLALLPLVVVGVLNKLFTYLMPQLYGATNETSLAGLDHPITTAVPAVAAIWALELALLAGILTVIAFGYRGMAGRFAEGTKAAVAGSLLASLNTASEYGFGSVIAALPGFIVIKNALAAIPNPLVNEAISVTSLAGITGSASGGLSIALAALSGQFIAAANAAHIPMEVLHRVAAMASGGMDTLPHNGAVITLLAVTGLTHRQSYKDIFAITCLKTLAVFVVIAVYYLTGIV
jgi:H+/gluconate symporter-like permease